MRVSRFVLLAIALYVSARVLFAGGEHSGQVTYGGLPVPGATVTASSGDKKLVTATDEEGVFRLPDATAGVWTLRVEMLGFEMLTRDVTVTAEPQPSAWTLMLRPFDDITRGIPRPAPAAAPTPAAGSAFVAWRSRAGCAGARTWRFSARGVTATPPPSAGNRSAGAGSRRHRLRPRRQTTRLTASLLMAA